MPTEVTTLLERLARKDKAPPGFIFTDRNDELIEDEDDEDDLTYYAEEDHDATDDFPLDDASAAGVDNELQMEAQDLQDDLDEEELEIMNENEPQPIQNLNQDQIQNQDLNPIPDAEIDIEPELAEQIAQEEAEDEEILPHQEITDDEQEDENPGVQNAGVQSAGMSKNAGVSENQDLDPDSEDETILDEARAQATADIDIPNESSGSDDENDQEVQTPKRKKRIIKQDIMDSLGTIGGHHLRPRRPKNHNFMNLDCIPSNRRLATVLANVDYSQHTLAKGIKIFGDRGVDAVLKEMKQLDYMDVVEPTHPEEMSHEEKKRALHYLMFLKQKKITAEVKARGCVDGRPQRAYTSKEETASPTVSIEGFMISCIIDALEKRNVATVDIPGAFMQTKQEDLVHVKLEGIMVDMLLKVAPGKYDKQVRFIGSSAKPYLYVRLKRALYGQLKAALLFWKNLRGKLETWGFELNPYDWCVANKQVNGKQCTVVWHVDDLKISHEDPKVVDWVIDQLKKEFAKEADLTITRRKIHEYLGMTLDYRESGKIKISMFDYIRNMLADLPEDMNGTSVTPAGENLFTVNQENPTKLSEEQSDFFHTNVAKLLFLCKRARPDIQTAVAFLCTRVQSPDTDDYKKLARVMRYLRATVEMPLTLEADNMSIIKWWVDASFGVLADMRSHTGSVMSLGKGAAYASSSKQKINTTSSTEAELVGIADALRQVLWTRYFIEAQGYEVTDNIVYRDNQASMRLEKNGRSSSSKRTRHINIRYFFVTDRIKKKHLDVIYCPTEEMTADYLTKANHGKLFRKFRNRLMNCTAYDPKYQDTLDHRSVLVNEQNAKGAMSAQAGKPITASATSAQAKINGALKRHVRSGTGQNLNSARRAAQPKIMRRVEGRDEVPMKVRFKESARDNKVPMLDQREPIGKIKKPMEQSKRGGPGGVRYPGILRVKK